MAAIVIAGAAVMVAAQAMITSGLTSVLATVVRTIALGTMHTRISIGFTTRMPGAVTTTMAATITAAVAATVSSAVATTITTATTVALGIDRTNRREVGGQHCCGTKCEGTDTGILVHRYRRESRRTSLAASRYHRVSRRNSTADWSVAYLTTTAMNGSRLVPTCFW